MRFIFILSLSCLLFACQNQPKYSSKITGPHAAEILVNQSNNATIFDIKSKTGIGKARLNSSTEDWNNCKIRLHLKGLEGFFLSTPTRVYEKSELEITKNADGYYDISLPNQLFKGQHTLSIQWVDFYR